MDRKHEVSWSIMVALWLESYHGSTVTGILSEIWLTIVVWAALFLLCTGQLQYLAPVGVTNTLKANGGHKFDCLLACWARCRTQILEGLMMILLWSVLLIVELFGQWQISPSDSHAFVNLFGIFTGRFKFWFTKLWKCQVSRALANLRHAAFYGTVGKGESNLPRQLVRD